MRKRIEQKMATFGSAGTDNQALRDIRDILQESRKQSKYMLWLTIVVAILTIIQIFFLMFR